MTTVVVEHIESHGTPSGFGVTQIDNALWATVPCCGSCMAQDTPFEGYCQYCGKRYTVPRVLAVTGGCNTIKLEDTSVNMITRWVCHWTGYHRSQLEVTVTAVKV